MIITTIHSFDSIGALAQAGVSGLIVGVEGVSIRSCIQLTLKELKEWKAVCDQNQLDLYVNAIKLFMDTDFDRVKEVLLVCKELDLAGLYFADEGVLWEAEAIHWSSHLIYQPETLMANHRDVQFYLDQGIQAVSLAHELSLDEIKEIAKNRQAIEILISGYFSILYSQRPLITNYLDTLGIQKDVLGKRLDLIEKTRDDRMPIVQDENGTHIYSEYPIRSVKEFASLQDAGIERFRIDSIFFDDQWTLRVLEDYKKGVESAAGSNHWYYQRTILKKGDNGNGQN